MSNLFVPLILGTARSGRTTAHAAHYILGQAQEYGFETELIDVATYVTSPVTGSALSEEKTTAWSATMQRADGLIIVAPEYNHGYPGELKLLLDQLYDEYEHKPLGLCGVSEGGIGGARVVEALRTVAIELQMIPLRHAVYFSRAKKLFDEKGVMLDASFKDRVIDMFSELALYASALKPVRSV